MHGANIHDAYTAGFGVNVAGWLGFEAGVNNDYNLTFSANITPWYHFGIEIGVSGINFTAGITVSGIDHDLSFGIGLGPALLIVGVVALVASGGSMIQEVLNFLSTIFS